MIIWLGQHASLHGRAYAEPNMLEMSQAASRVASTCLGLVLTDDPWQDFG